LLGTHGYGQCKVCLCDRYAKATVPVVSAATKAVVEAGK
jgi:hypothetical protein